VKSPSRIELPAGIEACRRQLEQDPLNEEAARQLRAHLVAAAAPNDLALAALSEVCNVLDGVGRWAAEPAIAHHAPRTTHANTTGQRRVLDRTVHEALVIHPRENQERQHQLSSLLGRVLHLLEGNEVARVVATVTEKAAPAAYPRLCEITAACARALEIRPPAIHIARGEERLFTVLLDRAPYLCVHVDFVVEGDAAAGGGLPFRLGEAETCFAVAHQLEHMKGGHAALLQIRPELLENLILDQFPFLVRTPIRLASKALGWTRANVAVKKAGEWLPGQSRTQRVVNTVGSLLPDKDQETVLPEVVHEWVRGWIQGVEYSADRAGLLVSGSVVASCASMLRLSPAYAPQVALYRQAGARRLLQENADADRPTADRLRELLRFAVSREYLAYVAGGVPS
jgi:hypothetical protein